MISLTLVFRLVCAASLSVELGANLIEQLIEPIGGMRALRHASVAREHVVVRVGGRLRRRDEDGRGGRLRSGWCEG